jgi:hypothetical protein
VQWLRSSDIFPGPGCEIHAGKAHNTASDRRVEIGHAEPYLREKFGDRPVKRGVRPVFSRSCCESHLGRGGREKKISQVAQENTKPGLRFHDKAKNAILCCDRLLRHRLGYRQHSA